MNKKQLLKCVGEHCINNLCSECEYRGYMLPECNTHFVWDILKENGMLKEPELDFSELKVDSLLLVTDDLNGDYIPRYFAKYEGDKVHCWINGATSKTSKGTTAWDYAKLYEESEEE